MDTLKEFLEEVKNRLTSPLIGSFVIAWLCFNWYIPVALFFYDQKELQVDHYNSYKQVIVGSANIWFNAIYPFLVAVAYTLIFPIIRVRIKEYQATINVRSENRIIDISSKAKKYLAELEKRDQFNEQLMAQSGLLRTQISENEKERERNLAEIERLLTELDSTKNDLKSYVKTADYNVKLNDQSYMVGRWKIFYTYNGHELTGLWNITSSNEVNEDGKIKYKIKKTIAYDDRIWLWLVDIGSVAIAKQNIITLFMLNIGPASNGNLNGEDQNGDTVTLQKKEFVLMDV